MSTITPQDLISREVHYCVSSLVYTLATTPGAHGDLAELCGQAQELSYPIEDHESAAIEDGWTLTGTELDRCMVFRHTDGRVNRNTTWGELCDEQDIQPHQREIYEHWIVSDWLAGKLEAKGERVDLDFAGLTVWGRTTTGQAIYMDAVIQEIHAELIAL